MDNPRLARIVIGCAWSFCVGSNAVVLAQGRSVEELPPGHYVYLGPVPGKIRARRFTLDSLGSVQWEGSTSNAQPSAETRTGTTDAPPHNAESYNYPVIKWKGKRVGGSARAAALLTTTYEDGMVKYSVTLGP